jgi:hypothetical protein
MGSRRMPGAALHRAEFGRPRARPPKPLEERNARREPDSEHSEGDARPIGDASVPFCLDAPDIRPDVLVACQLVAEEVQVDGYAWRRSNETVYTPGSDQIRRDRSIVGRRMRIWRRFVPTFWMRRSVMRRRRSRRFLSVGSQSDLGSTDNGAQLSGRIPGARRVASVIRTEGR